MPHTRSVSAISAALLLLGLLFPFTFARAVSALPAPLPFTYEFSPDGAIRQSPSPSSSDSPYFWVMGGGTLAQKAGIGITDPAASYFQMLSRLHWKNINEAIYVRVKGDVFPTAASRNPWNGISLYGRYQNENTFYYGGIRQDGYAVVKKKLNGVYTTLASKKVYSGTYSASTNPNLIPKNAWIGIKTEAKSNTDGSVTLRVLIDQNRSGIWTEILRATDASNVISNEGLWGIRIDAMNVEFDNITFAPAAVLATAPVPVPTVEPAPTSSDPVSSSEPPTATPTPLPSGALFSDTFNRPDGIIVNEASMWSPGSASAASSPIWEMNSGTFYALSNQGWSGVPSASNNSGIFRLTTKQANFGNIAVSFDLTLNSLTTTAATPATGWDGVHIFLRYQSEESLYYASVSRRDGTVVIKKKVPGGSSNGGTYYNVSTYNRAPFPLGSRIPVKATIETLSDGSVKIQLFANGSLIVTGIDKGLGGAPIRNAGKVGIRGDNANFFLDNFAVTAL